MLPKSPDNEPISLDAIREVLAKASTHLEGSDAQPAEATKLYDEAIEALHDRDNSKDQAARHLQATAWLQKTSILLSSPTEDSGQAIQDGFQQAIALFDTLPVKDNSQYATDCVALWTTIGQSQLNSQNGQSIEGAIGCFERAMSFLHLLPWQENLQLRSHLIGLWFNIGTAHTRLKGPLRHTAALNAYSQALVFSNDFPAENPQAALMIANIWLSRGSLFSQSDKETLQKEAIFSFEKSIAVLQKAKPADDPNVALALSRSHANRALTLSAMKDQAAINATSIKESVASAISLAAPLIDKSPMAAESTLNARMAFSRNQLVLLQDANETDALEFYENASDEIDESMALIRKCEGKGFNGFRHLARNFFKVGTRLYQVRQPHFLAEFINECIGEGQALRQDDAMIAIARTCIQETVDGIAKNNPVIVGSPESEALLAIVDPLKKILESLPEAKSAET